LPENTNGDLFERIKDKVNKQYENFLFAQPYQHAVYAADLCFEPSKWSINDKVKALASLTLEDFVSFSKMLLSRFHLEVLVHGNASPEEAKVVTTTMLDRLQPTPPFQSNLPQLRVVQLQNGSEYVHRLAEFNEENTNSSMEILFQVGQVDVPNNAILAFVHHLIKEPAFHDLRTSEQLGYIVHTSIKTSGDDIKSILFLIQSDSFDPIYLDERVEVFLDKFRSKITSMTPEEFQVNIDAVVELLLEKNKNLAEESSKYWNVMTNGSYLFQKFQLLGKEVKKMTVEKVLRFFDKYVARDAPKRRKLCIQVFGKNHVERMKEPAKKGVTLITEDGFVEFRNGMGLFPLAKEVDVEGMKM